MWKQLFDLVQRVASVTQDTQKNKADIKILQDEMKALTEVVRQVVYDIQRDRENQAHEREKLLLRLEVALLRSEHRTLTGKTDEPFLEQETNSLPDVPE